MNIIIKLVLMACACLAWTAPASAEVTNMKTITIDTTQTASNCYDEARCRMGVLMFDNDPTLDNLYTIEKPWLPNFEAPDGVGGGVPDLSAVPLGEYDMVLRESPAHGLRWHFYNPELHVYLEKADRNFDWERFSTMFHSANYVEQVLGCVGPGCSRYDFGGTRGLGVGSSKVAVDRIHEYLYGESKAKLRII